VYDATIKKPIWSQWGGWVANKTEQRNTSYILGDIIINANGVFECITAGTSGATAPDWTNHTTNIQDGTTVWDYVSSTPAQWIDATGVVV
jgi:hypothetical protein